MQKKKKMLLHPYLSNCFLVFGANDNDALDSLNLNQCYVNELTCNVVMTTP